MGPPRCSETGLEMLAELDAAPSQSVATDGIGIIGGLESGGGGAGTDDPLAGAVATFTEWLMTDRRC
jgi:hypothetical protein